MNQNPADQRSKPADPDIRQRVIVVVPGRAADVLRDGAGARWLGSATIRPQVSTMPMLERVLEALGHPAPKAGRAALRFWGQTGERPTGWIAAADPIWMQAGLEKVFVHVPPVGEVDCEALRTMYRDLHETLFIERQLSLHAHDELGYVRGDGALLTAELPATAIDRSRPDAFMPDISVAGARDYYSLCSEIEMTLHAHPFNQERERGGQRPLNALWLWGGGTVTQSEPCNLPPLYADDPLLQGFYRYSDAACSDWPGTLSACLEQAPTGFIAALPDPSVVPLDAAATDIKSLWQQRRVRRLTILLDDIVIDIERGLRNLFRRGGTKQLRKYLSDE